MGCHGPEGHDGKEPRHEKKQRLTTSSRGDHDSNLAEKLRIEASPKNSSYKVPFGNFTNLERNLREEPKRARGTAGRNSVVRVRP